MKKRNIGIGLVLLIYAISLSVPAWAVGEAPKEIDKQVTIKYTNGIDIVDPENPLDPDYVITVPAALSFSKEERIIDATISMNDLNGKRYSGEKMAQVKVQSNNSYALEHTDNFKRISYKLVKYDTTGKIGTALANTKPEIGILSKTNTVIKSEAMLGVTTIAKENIGTYADILTYTVENL